MAPHRVAAIKSALGTIFGALSLTAAARALVQDPFTWAWLFLVVVSVWDYRLGVSTARADPETYCPERRARGRREKVSTLLLMLACRGVEAWATAYGVLDAPALLRWVGVKGSGAPPGGIVASFITMMVVMEEMSSIYRHRLENGGKRILLLELVFNGLAAFQQALLGRAARATAQWAGGDAAEEYAKRLEANRRMENAAHRAAHGIDAPERRASDVARREVREVGLLPDGAANSQTGEPPPPQG